MSALPTPPPVVVEVIDEERIAPRGTAQVNWFVRLNDGWVHVSAWPGALYLAQNFLLLPGLLPITPMIRP